MHIIFLFYLPYFVNKDQIIFRNYHLLIFMSIMKTIFAQQKNNYSFAGMKLFIMKNDV